MRVKYLANAISRYNAALGEVLGDSCGLDDFVVEALEEKYCMSFPSAYKEYLSWMGYVSSLFSGSNCSIDCLDENNRELAEWFEDGYLGYNLPSKYLCFSSHQGYSFAWFEEGEDNDPICYFFSEGYNDLRSRRFSEYIELSVEELIQQLEEFPEAIE